MYEVLVEAKSGEFIGWDLRHTEKDAHEVAARLRKEKKNVRVIDRDYKKPPKEDRFGRGRGRRDRDEYEE